MEILRLYLFLAIIPVFMTEGVAKTSQCSLEKTNDCVGESHSDLGSDIVPLLSNTELDRICSELEQTESCLNDLAATCEASNITDPTEKAKLNQRIDEMLKGRSYMCDSSKRKTYEENVQPCYESNMDALDDAAATCLDSYKNKTWYLNRGDEINLYKFCMAAREYLVCQTDAVDQQCGGDSAQWVKGYHQGLWQSHMGSIKCSSDEGMEGGAIVIMSLCTGAIVYCLFFVALGFVRDSDKFKCTALKKHTKSGYLYTAVKQSQQEVR